MLNQTQVEEAAECLKAARIDNKVIAGLPEDCRPQTLAQAYAIQDRLTELLGWEVGGWFCACTNARIQEILNLSEPYYARLFTQYILPSPARLEAAAFPPIVLECEFGFRLAHDLPSRSAPYTRADVEAAIASVHPTIEVVAGHLENWPEQNVFSVIADNGTDGALIYGDGVTDWRDVDLVACRVMLTVDGSVVREGNGANVLGDPMAAFVWLANARSRDGDGLRAGDIHNTGTATDIYWLDRTGRIEVDFAGLGSVRLEVA